MIFDVEADGLLDKATKIHVMAYTDGKKVLHTHDYDVMRELLLSAKILIGHNIIRYDIPLLEKLLGIKIEARLIDTLALSWYLNHSRFVHGLDQYGEYYGIEKPKIDDWNNLTPEEYAHRCVEDVKINKKLWVGLKSKLMNLYGSKDKADKLLKYLEFKLDCAREQERSQWKIDVELAEKCLLELTQLQDEKVEQLKLAMPTVDKFAVKTRPKKPFKQDGSKSVTGAKWFNLLKERGLPEDYDGEVKVKVSEEEPNPNSHEQIKSWLYSLGWEPCSFKFERNKETLEERQIPQVRVDGDDGKELAPSVLELVDIEPALEHLQGLSVIQHRLSIFKGFLENRVDGYIQAQINGLTNTLRFKHKVLVNLPGVDKPWGKEIRGCLIAEDGEILCGSDMSSLEDNTKKHYMWKHDPDFVIEMSKPGFDPHLDLAKFAKVVTQQEIDDWVAKLDSAKNLTPIRKDYKVVNYSATYGVKPPKLSRTIKSSIQKAEKLLDDFWKRNWAITAIAEECEVKTLDGEMWLYNPVSELWYSLRNEKDRFSTLNQGTGVYCFDTWIKHIRNKRKQLTAQFHDEIVACLKEKYKERYKKLLLEAMDNTNEELQLNVTLSIDVQFGKTYAEIH